MSTLHATDIVRDDAGRFAEREYTGPEVALLPRHPGSASPASGYGSVAEAAAAGERAAYAGLTAAPETDAPDEVDSYMAAYESIVEGQP